MDHPQPVTDEQKDVLRQLLPKVIMKFVHDQEDHVSDRKTYFEAWLEMPGQRERYASLGFMQRVAEPLYWTVPPVQLERFSRYREKGYGDDYKNYLWRYVSIPVDFWGRSARKQETWLVGCIEALLREDEQLRGL